MKPRVKGLYTTTVMLILACSLNLFGLNKKEQIVLSDIHGLPRNIVFEVAQDHFGYLWVATESGIARFDGLEFHVYPNFASQAIFTVFVDSKNNVWMGTAHGAYKLNRITDKFDLVREAYTSQFSEDENGVVYYNALSTIRTTNEQNDSLFSSYRIYQFALDEKGIWYSDYFDGAKLVSKNSNYSAVIDSVLIGENVTCIRNINGDVYFGCRDGEVYVKQKENALSQITINNHYYIRDIVLVDQEIWIATDGNGIIVLDDNFNLIEKLNRAPHKQVSINTNSIYDLYYGNNGEVWAGSYGAGLTCLMPESELFKNIVPEKGVKNSLVANEGILASRIGEKLILGTNYGFSIYDETNNSFTNFGEERLKEELNGIKILGAVKDMHHNYWIATYDGLLGKYNSNFELIETYAPCSNDKTAMQQIIYLSTYQDKYLLIGTQFPNRSLLKLNIETNAVSVFTLEKDALTTTYFDINAIKFNHKGELLTQVSNIGLFKVNFDNNKLEQVYHEASAQVTSWIIDFYQRKNGDIWFTTKKGLYQYIHKTKEVNNWTVKDGLPSISLQRIESIDDKHLWIGTLKGICRFNTETYELINYDYNDGLATNEFSMKSSSIISKQRIIFGSIAGFTIIDPSKVVENFDNTDVVISDILFQNKSIKDLGLLNQPLETTKEITLPYHKNSFTIKFFTKNKAIPKFGDYLCRLKGFDNDWISAGRTNQTTFNNLLPGKYIFQVRNAGASNQAENSELHIKINHPWYFSLYAYVVYILLIASILIAFFYGYVNRINYKKEVEIAGVKIQSEHELTEKKLAFFTNISHDLKTPLTLIDAPVYDLLKSENLNDEERNQLLVIRRNSKRLKKLINDLLDFRKLTKKKLPLAISETDINSLFNNVYNAFRAECQNKSIDLYKNTDVKSPLYVDAGKIEQILWNLLSNAIKYTEEDGQIFLIAEEIKINEKPHLKIIVKDSGVGIPSKFIDKIFERFYQIPDGKTKQNEGTGIGLSIVNDLVEIHYGQVEVDSKPHVGTTFTITLPAFKERYKEHEMQKEVFESNVLPQELFEEQLVKSEESTSKNKQYNLPILLIVEDNFELRKYLCNHFHKNFKVIEAEDGLKGMELVRDKVPDMVITDISMPNLNGYEFCKQLRSNFETSHVPLIMLTANSTVDQQIEGIQLGADAYITKPFDIELLEKTLYTIIENRKRIRNKLLAIESSDNSEDELPEKDENFITDLVKHIEDNMINQDLNVEILAKHFSVSRVQLNRKVKSLTGKTTIKLINSIRLKKAYELIKKDKMRVSEAAYNTGFNDPNYFTICFKKEFGENPSKLS